MAKKVKIEADSSTEEKIKEAARKVFTRKGYAATRTRDIAEESGINLALLNYYFRSKEKLFEIVMMEKMQKLLGIMGPLLNDPTTDLETKINKVATGYIDLLKANPDLPIFVLSEIRNNPDRFVSNMNVKKMLLESHFVKQLHEVRPDINPFHFIMNSMGMLIFPFVIRPVFQAAGGLTQPEFEALMEQRKTLIPLFLKGMLNAT